MQNATAPVPTEPIIMRLIERGKLRTEEQRQRVLRAAVGAVYGNYCSSSIAELEEAVVEFMRVPLERDDD